MRKLLALLLSSAALTAPAFALGDLVSFARVQSECVEAGGVSFGAEGRWADCRVSKGRWFSTIGITDFYQAQYCLGRGERCEARALLLFANRAYTPAAKMLLERIDPGDTEYEDPLVLDTAAGKILTLAAHRPGGPPTRSYYLWQNEQWAAIDTDSWRRELARRLPAGTSVRDELAPDLETMRAQARLFRRRDADCCPSGSAEIELGLAMTRLTVKSVKLKPAPM